ncbi:kelch-like protein 5 [Anastrepha ludens]|uniref:kelch-like protein 5 n=1 Tax=Anastrepha ludens TaxID=28586 RepID=UPI0023AF3ADB|nr:kelch-like protein 5 [Anastrepha ludens]
MTSALERSERGNFNYAIKHFAKVSNSADFLELSPEFVREITDSDELNVDCEVDVFQAIMRWYEHDKEGREEYLASLVTSLKLVQFHPAFILKHIKPLPGCEQIANEALKLITESTGGSRISPVHTKTRSERKCVLMILNDVKKLKYILRYNLALDKWQKCFELKFIDYSYGLIYHKNSLLFIGGRSRGVQRNNAVKRLDLVTFKWMEMANMSQRRDDLCVAILNENIYAFGGHDGGDPFNTVEMFDIGINEWQMLPAMSDHRYGASAIVYEGRIYIFGGLGIDCEPLRSVECYDPTTNSWSKCGNMHQARGWPGVTILNGFIFLIGGFNEGMLSTVERFDPQQNTCTKLSSLNAARFGICAITIGNQIWAVGGHDVYTVEEYDSDNDKWIEKSPLPVYGIHSHVEVPNNFVDKLQSKYMCTPS